RNLRDMDVFSKSDPCCVVFHQPFGSRQWQELKRTECIDNTLNPDFMTKVPITYHFEEQQHLKFCIYDFDSTIHDLSQHDFIGSYECTLAQLVSARTLEQFLINPEYGSNNGSIVITTEELSASKEELCIQFVGKKLENTHWFSSISTFLEFYKTNENGQFTLVHRTATVYKTVDPAWKEMNVQLRTFCSADYDLNLKVVCKEFVSNGNHKEIGTFFTTVRKLMMGPSQENNYWLINEHRK
ncbi:unnamed protein product, partial [Meganyctiphanes norvegica]